MNRSMRLSAALLMGTVLAPMLGAQTDARMFPVPANLKPDGIPQLAQGLFDQTGPYSDSRSASLLDWRPGAREILILTRFGQVPQLHRVSMPGGDRRQVTFFPDRIGGASWNPASADQIIFTKDTGGNEFYQLYLLSEKDGRVKLLTDGKRSRNSMANWSRNGRFIAWTSTARNGKDGDIMVMEPGGSSPPRIVVQGKDETWMVDDWSPDGNKLLVSLGKSAVVSELYLVDVATGNKEKLGPDAPDRGDFNAKFSADGKSVFMISNAASDYDSLAWLDLTTHKATSLRPEIRWDFESIALSGDGRHLAYLVNEDGVSKLHVMDTSTRQDVLVPAIPAGVIAGLQWRPGSQELGFALSASKTPGDVYSFNVGSNRVEQWTSSETGGLDASRFVEPELIHWKSFDGIAISGFLYRPAAGFTGPRPVIINIHGGPEGQSRPLYNGSRNYYVNELGIVVIYPNVRGSTGYGTTFLNADNGLKREDSVRDIGALLDWIKTQPTLDSSRVMVTGGSYGGYMTLATMKLYNDRVCCALEQVGISNFTTFLQRTEPYRVDLRRVEYGDERDPKMRDFFDTIAPLNSASKMTKPMFVVAGRNDPRVSWKEGQQMVDALRQSRVPSWFLVAEDEGHGYVKKENQDYLFAASVEFVREYLLK